MSALTRDFIDRLTPEQFLLSKERERQRGELRRLITDRLDRFCKDYGKYRWFTLIQQLLDLEPDPVAKLLTVDQFFFPHRHNPARGWRKTLSERLRLDLGLDRAVYDVRVFRARQAWDSFLGQLREDSEFVRQLRNCLV